MRIREDGESCVKIKGLDIRGTSVVEEKKRKGKAPQQQQPQQQQQSQVEQLEEEEAYGSCGIEKIKIEFNSRKEKQEFLDLTRELQGLSSW